MYEYVLWSKFQHVWVVVFSSSSVPLSCVEAPFICSWQQGSGPDARAHGLNGSIPPPLLSRGGAGAGRGRQSVLSSMPFSCVPFIHVFDIGKASG